MSKIVYEKSQHFKEDREKRERFILNTIGLGEELDTFEEIDKKYGKPVLHIITDTGVYKIMTPDRSKLITMWIARPQQLKDLYKKHHAQLPKWLLQKAIDHKQMCYTYVGEASPHNHFGKSNHSNALKDMTRKSQRKSKVIY